MNPTPVTTIKNIEFKITMEIKRFFKKIISLKFYKKLIKLKFLINFSKLLFVIKLKFYKKLFVDFNLRITHIKLWFMLSF